MMPKLTNNPIFESFAAHPLLVDDRMTGLVTANLAALNSEDGQLLLADKMNNEDDYWAWGDRGSHPYRPYNVQDGILMVPVYGTLLNRFDYQFGRYVTGYQYLEKAMQRGIEDDNVKGILLVVDSPGGEVAGCFELVDRIYGMRGEKPIRAIANDHAYSAAYAIATAASEITVTRSGGTGSVGVVTMHVSYEEALSKMGLEVTFIFAGKHKVEGNAYQSLSDSAKSRIQKRIDRSYGVFTGTVARNRGIEESSVRETEALTYDAEDSVNNGFADRVGTLDDEMATFREGAANTAEGTQLMTTKDTKDTATTFTQEQMDSAVSAAKAEGVTEGVTAERERRSTIMGHESAAKRPVAAQQMVDKGIDADMAVDLLAGLPEESAKVEQTTPKTTPKAKTTPFDAAMSNGNPEVGATVEDDDQMNDPEELATNAIVSASKTFRGKRPSKA